jgi:hypothetical protein
VEADVVDVDVGEGEDKHRLFGSYVEPRGGDRGEGGEVERVEGELEGAGLDGREEGFLGVVAER